MIPAAAFNPTMDPINHYNDGARIEIVTGAGGFVTPVYLPRGARIRLVTLFAGDYNINLDICANLYESNPKNGAGSLISQVCTSKMGGYQQRSTKTLSHYVKWYYGYYIRLFFPGWASLTFHSVSIKYTVNQ
jgi:hypothetical protein